MAAGGTNRMSTVLIIVRDYALEKELGALKLEKRGAKNRVEFWFVASHNSMGDEEEDRYYRVTWERGEMIQRLMFDRDFFALGDLMNLVTIYGGRIFTPADLAVFKSGSDPLFEKRKQSYETPF